MKSKPGSITPEKTKYHAEILANRVRTRFRHLSRRFKRENIDCFRLYDWDIPEVRAVVDWYAGHLVVGEYVRWQTGSDWLPQMAKAVAETLGVPPERTHTRRRRTNTKERPRYGKIDFKKERFKVRERDLQFWVNLDDFLDTGLFSDHRDTRVIVRKLAAGKDFLNLYAYTGAFTCAAASGERRPSTRFACSGLSPELGEPFDSTQGSILGVSRRIEGRSRTADGAKTTVSVDRSLSYINWAKDNLELNGLWGPQHTLVQSDVSKFLAQAQRERRRFTLAFVDPPSFFKDRGMDASFDINRDHPQLIQNVLKVMAPGSVVFFSTNHQRFEPQLEGLPVKNLIELTPKTIPEDYRNRRVHRCWQMTAA